MVKSSRPLSVRRKADRLAMAERLTEIAQRHGADVDVECGAALAEVTITVRHPSGLRCYVWFHDDLADYVIPWHLDAGCCRRLAPSFGSVNPHHFQKATHVAAGWEALAREIDRGLSAAADGTAYQEPA